MKYARISNQGFHATEWKPESHMKELIVGDRTYWIEPKGKRNRYLSQLTGLEVNGTGITPITDDKDLLRLQKHYESIAHDNKWDICPMCDDRIVGTGALSRVDNVTTICSACGLKEGIQDFKRAENTEFARTLVNIKQSRDYKIAKDVIKKMKETSDQISMLINTLEALDGNDENETVDARMTEIWVETIVEDPGIISMVGHEFLAALSDNLKDVDEAEAVFESAFVIGAHYMMQRLKTIIDSGETPDIP